MWTIYTGKRRYFSPFRKSCHIHVNGLWRKFLAPDKDNNEVRCPKFVDRGKAYSLVFIQGFDEFLEEQHGTANLDALDTLDRLAFFKHRFLNIAKGDFFGELV